jgi:2-oxo-4-hydroxy-4-carboxy-5-ureidoimidazoline decarboxylase
MTITELQLRESLPAALGVSRWIDEVAAAAPYQTVDDLVVRADQAATVLSQAEVDEALADHPRIGEKPQGDGAAQDFSRSEQASLGADDPSIDAAIADGNRAYEQRFGRVFLIRAAGRTRGEILAELRRRLELDDDAELTVVGEQLREIALIRIRAQFEGVTA